MMTLDCGDVTEMLERRSFKQQQQKQQQQQQQKQRIALPHRNAISMQDLNQVMERIEQRGTRRSFLSTIGSFVRKRSTSISDAAAAKTVNAAAKTVNAAAKTVNAAAKTVNAAAVAESHLPAREADAVRKESGKKEMKKQRESLVLAKFEGEGKELEDRSINQSSQKGKGNREETGKSKDEKSRSISAERDEERSKRILKEIFKTGPRSISSIGTVMNRVNEDKGSNSPKRNFKEIFLKARSLSSIGTVNEDRDSEGSKKILKEIFSVGNGEENEDESSNSKKIFRDFKGLPRSISRNSAVSKR